MDYRGEPIFQLGYQTASVCRQDTDKEYVETSALGRRNSSIVLITNGDAALLTYRQSDQTDTTDRR